MHISLGFIQPHLVVVMLACIALRGDKITTWSELSLRIMLGEIVMQCTLCFHTCSNDCKVFRNLSSDE
jgi:hypothetical protein